MTASHPQYFIVIDSISPHSNSQLLTAIHCDEPNTGFEPRLISAHFFCPLVWLAVTFKADQPNQKWVTDVTEFALFGIKLYLSPIIDLYNGEVISYNLSRHPNLNQVTDMLEKAFSKIPDNTNLILHSDQGWQYQHKHYQKMLKEKGIRQSMSRKGNCLDNACAENFFGLLKTELLYLQEFHSVEHFIEELHEYIEWYNNKRIKLKLNGLSPVEFRQEAA